MLWANSANDKLMIFFSYFSQKIGFDLSCKLGDNLHEMSNLFSSKNIKKTNISKCHLLIFLPSMLSVMGNGYIEKNLIALYMNLFTKRCSTHPSSGEKSFL